MKRFTLLLTLLVLSGVQASAGTFDFVIGPSGTNLTFKFQVDGAVGLAIDWGDGQNETLSGTGIKSHTYAVGGLYTNRVSGTATRIAFGVTGATPFLLRDIVSRMSDGVTGIKSADQMFYNATNITQFSQADWFDAASANVTSMRTVFSGAPAFNQDISGWDVSKVKDMNEMFNGASSFNQNIGGWDVSKLSSMNWMFSGASAFNQNIGGWVVTNVTTMPNLFNKASAFNQDISGWKVSKVTDMGGMFLGASAFNQNIGGWNVSNVTSMASMFRGTPFNQAIGGWNVGKVTSMWGMFNGATNFNQNIGNWDVGNVTDMSSMFTGATAFNQAIGGWNVSKVALMANMFYEATVFNQNIGAWDVSNVTSMNLMFYRAYAYKQDVSRWNVSKVTNFIGFLSGCTLPTDNYNQLLIRWSRLPLKSILTFDGGYSRYDKGFPEERRQYIKNTFTWTINDYGPTTNTYRMPLTVFSVR